MLERQRHSLPGNASLDINGIINLKIMPVWLISIAECSVQRQQFGTLALIFPWHMDPCHSQTVTPLICDFPKKDLEIEDSNIF